MKYTLGGLLGLIVVSGLLFFYFNNQKAVDSELKNQKEEAVQLDNMSHQITLKTNQGEIVFTTYDVDAPKTVENFIKLASEGFYDGVIFHRVIDGFMIQGGDPTGTGRGGPGYTFADELNPETESYQKGYLKGTVAMANAGPNTNGSQFFIMVADYPLPNDYTIFGQVISGQEVADNISVLPTDEADKPLEDVIIEEVEIEKVES
ncbi:MAG: peptidylprolyl isomerase [Patescibacteria group bacterium]